MKVLGNFKTMLTAGMLALAMVAIGTVSQVSAAEDVPKQRIQLSPARFDVADLKPGETKEITLKVQNTGSEVLRYEISATPYSVKGEDYQQDFSTETNYTNLAKWISFSQDTGEVQPDKQDEVTIIIKVPNDVPAGGQYATVMVRMLNEGSEKVEEGASITAYNQVGSIIFADVAGETRKEGSIIDNKVPSFMFAPPISATSIVENTGNIHVNATYILQVYPLFGGEEIYTNEEKPMVVPILPETRRLNTITWEGAPHLGIFKIKQTVKFLDQTSVTEKVLFICPIWFLLIVLVLIFLIIFWIVSRVRGGRKEA